MAKEKSKASVKASPVATKAKKVKGPTPAKTKEDYQVPRGTARENRREGLSHYEISHGGTVAHPCTYRDKVPGKVVVFATSGEEALSKYRNKLSGS